MQNTIPAFPSSDDYTLLIVDNKNLSALQAFMLDNNIGFVIIDADNKYQAENITDELYTTSSEYDISGCEY